MTSEKCWSQQHESIFFFPFSEEPNVFILFQTYRFILVNSDALGTRSQQLMCIMQHLQLINDELAGLSD